jgi:hypothetical protein
MDRPEGRLTTGAELAKVAALEKARRMMGAEPAEGYCSPESVPRDKWLVVELWTGAEWQPDPSVTL